MNVLQNLKKFKIPRNQLKLISGGSSAILAGPEHTHECSCANQPGTWTGNYGSQSRAESSLARLCEDGQGSCSTI
ncbi:hypothetical protein ACWGOQ_0017285 [Aquimarina sp. M1]